MAEEQKQQPLKSSSEPVEEKLEFLKREEVRTMAKDIAMVREKEAKKEQDRIANLKRETKLPKAPQVVLSQHSERKPEEISSKYPESPQKMPQKAEQLTSSQEKQEPKKQPLLPKRRLKRSEKLFIRIVVGGIILFLIFNAVAFGFWYFFKKDTQKQPEPKNIQQQKEVAQDSIAPKPTPVLEPETFINPPEVREPAIFFEAPEKNISLETSEELLEKLKAFLEKDLSLEFLNIIVSAQENILSSDQFFTGTSILVPQELKEKLGEGLMLFSYTAQQKKRLGFLVELKETENVSELLQSWEQNMERDLSSFFNIIGGKGSAYTLIFRSSVYMEIPVRFQTFSVIDFGIVYGIIDNKLLITSSFESFKRVVDKLKTYEP